jgi:hypothetical protein
LDLLDELRSIDTLWLRCGVLRRHRAFDSFPCSSVTSDLWYPSSTESVADPSSSRIRNIARFNRGTRCHFTQFRRDTERVYQVLGVHLQVNGGFDLVAVTTQVSASYVISSS